MLNMIKEFFGIQDNSQDFNDGYKWAKEQLKEPQGVAFITAITHTKTHPFDRGARKALQEHNKE